MPPRQRALHRATVTASERISPQLVRIAFDCPAMIGAEFPHTDHYIKLLFPPPGADYAWPFDPAAIREATPQQAPVTRTYTLRSIDPKTGALVVDFVIHGDEGLAGPWAAAARPGDEIGFLGPGGAWHPISEFSHFVFAGDESAAPAISAALEALPLGATADVFLEITDAAASFDVPIPEGSTLTWVARDGAGYGTALARAVREAPVPTQRTGWFVHGVAEMVKDLRSYLFVDLGLPRSDVSISGYWRSGMTEDGWQSSKHEFVATMDAEELAAGAAPAQAKPAK